MALLTSPWTFSINLHSVAARGRTRIYLDTADEKQWAKYLPLGIWDGITTNPLLCRRAGVEVTEHRIGKMVGHALEKVDEVMVQAWGGTVDLYVTTGTVLSRLEPKRVIVKLPLTREGVQAASVLRDKGVRLCMTACYAQHQVFTSVGLGAEFVAPYLGRMTDAGKDGLEEVKSMQKIVEGMGSSTRVLVASLREASQLAALASAGCDSFTFSPAIAEELFNEPLTINAAASFEEDAREAGHA